MHWVISSMSSSPRGWLTASEWILLVFGALVVVGLVGEVLAENRTSRFWKICKTISIILVISGVAGELLGDGGVFEFSGRLQTQTDNLLSRQGDAITQLTAQLNVTQAGLAAAIETNQGLLAAQQFQSQQVAQLQTKEGGPFAWTMSLYAPTSYSTGGPMGTYDFATFTPTADITITRIVSPFLGSSGTATRSKMDACWRPPYFYLSLGNSLGVLGKNVLYTIPLQTGSYGRGDPTVVDTGPISVNVPAGQKITASYQTGFDPRNCWTQPTRAPGVPDNITVEYVTRPHKSNHRADHIQPSSPGSR